jgi:hypothetical protein
LWIVYFFDAARDDYTDAADAAKNFMNRLVISNLFGCDDCTRPHRDEVRVLRRGEGDGRAFGG